MIRNMFEWLSASLQASPLIALFGSLVWGVLSIILSPCHLASVPLIVGFVGGQGKTSTRRAFLMSLVFATGIFITIAIVGFVTGLMGRMLGDVGRYGNYIVATLFFVVGLYLLNIIPMPWSGLDGTRFKIKGMPGALLLGLIFGVAVGPCTFAYMAPILTVVFKTSAKDIIYGIILLFVYAIGHCSLIVIAGTSTEVVQRVLNWNEFSKGAVILKRICGVLVILGGIYMILSM